MNYDENVFKAKANIKARRIWLVFSLLLTANYGADMSNGLYPSKQYLYFVLLCWIPFFIGELFLKIKGKTTDIYRYILVLGYGIFYTYLLCTTASPIAFTYILPVTSLLIIFKENIVKYIYLYKTFDTMRTIFYAAPYELMIIGSNTNKSMSSYLANLNILENITAILTPIFSGFVIEKFSYNALFSLLAIETILIIIISFKIKDFTIQDNKMNLKEYWEKSKDKKHLKDIYKCMFFRRISSQGAMTELLPIVLFLRLGTEFSFGGYNTMFALISIVSLQILKIINKKNIKKKFYPYMAIVIFISALMVVFDTSFVTLLIYYIFMNSFGTIIESESCSAVYAAIKVDNLEKYRKEHIMTFNIYMLVGQLISYSLVFVLYNYFYNVNILSITIAILMFFLIIATIYLRKTENYIYNSYNKYC